MRSERIKVIEDLADKKQQDAAVVMQDARKQWQQHLQQLESLNQYRLEYQQKLKNQNGKLISVHLVREYTHFIEKISQAIEQQQTVVQQFEQIYKQKQGLWITTKRKLNAMTKVRESIQADELHIENMNEQKVMDEYSVNLFHQNKANK